MSFQNIYFKRATATARACYVCSKPTTTVSPPRTQSTSSTHPGFATEIIVDPPKETVSKEEISRVKAEWEAKEARKKDKRDKSPSPPVPGALGSPPAASNATPTHKRYSLHRDFYAMRQAEHRRKRQTKQMQELAPRLPGAPRGSPLG
ncbi:hypothetical protein EI94DRAFT_1719918 [Lactarius quietus]|nr:hypothetical protein EI94DRAFT_1719918 [Lactarius quietus]